MAKIRKLNISLYVRDEMNIHFLPQGFGLISVYITKGIERSLKRYLLYIEASKKINT
jgi:hypothetical protein